MSYQGQSPKVKRTRFTPQASDPANAIEGDLFYSDGTPRAEGLWYYNSLNTWIAVTASTVPLLAVTTKTANYTATIFDDVILANAIGGTFTITLPTAVANTGKVLYIKKVDSSATSTVTVDANGSQTIDGALFKTLALQNSELTIVSNGSNWDVLASIGTLPAVTPVVGNYTALPTDDLLYCVGTLTVTMPPSGHTPGKIYTIKNVSVSGEIVTVSGVDGGSYTLTSQNSAVIVQSSALGDGWEIISNYTPVSTPFNVNVSASSTVAWPAASGTWFDFASISLTPGTWTISAQYGAIAGALGVTTNIDIGVSTTSGNSATGLNFSNNRTSTVLAANSNASAFIVNYIVSPTTTTTYYLKGLCTGSLVGVNYRGYRATATRLK